LGYFDGETAKDGSYRTIGYYYDGTMKGPSYRTCGYIEDGAIKLSSYRTLGYYEADDIPFTTVEAYVVAWAFFFSDMLATDSGGR